MGKEKSKSAREKPRANVNNTRGGETPITWTGFGSHDAFEAVLRRYAHPAAVSDLDKLAPGGSERMRYLEAFGKSCEDIAKMFEQQLIMANPNPSLMGKFSVELNMDCPLVRALIESCGRQWTERKLRTEGVYGAIIYHFLRTYGRPLPTKATLLAEHDTRVVKLHGSIEQMKLLNNSRNNTIMLTTSSSVRMGVSLHKSKIGLSNLTKISIKDLTLYDSHDGKYIEGKLLVEPFTPFVGTTMILEYSNGDVILVTLYIFLPDGLHGRESDPVANAKIPKGCIVCIAEPFQKVFQDGS